MGRGIRGERNLGPNQNASRRAWQAGVVFGSLKLVGPTSLGASSRAKVEVGSTVVDVPAPLPVPAVAEKPHSGGEKLKELLEF